jgi:predicted cupin superfamily sugar epimerase
MQPSAQQIIELLGLTRHSTCGFATENFQSALSIPAAALPAEYGGPRKLGGTLYFLVMPEAPVRLHRIRSDQMYHYYFGVPLEVLLLYPDGRSEVRVAGPDLAAGQRPQILIPGGTFHAGRVLHDGRYSMLGTSVWARAESEDVEQGDVEKLIAAFPAAGALITSFAK